jgi:hypothetical protein
VKAKIKKMKDIKAISKTYYGKIKSGLGFKTEYAKSFKEGNLDYYLEMFNTRPQIHQDLIRFLQSKKDVKTVLEVGCSIGNYPIQYHEIFSNIIYTGLDISQRSIDYCKKNSNFEFICDDFLKMDIDKKYDFVFSMGVVDHVYDIDLFISKIIKLTNKYAYINSYRGYFPNTEEHKMEWKDADGIFYNDLSVEQVKRVLINNNLRPDEFVIHPQPRGDKTNHVELTIEIVKK